MIDLRMRCAAIAAALAVAATGCGGDPGTGRTARPSPSTIGAAQLRTGLVDAYDGFGALTRPVTGRYPELPTAAAAGGVRDAPPQVTFTPATCKKAVWSGPDAAEFRTAPAAVVALGQESGDGARLWDELVAAPGGRAAAALGGGPVPGCAKVRGAYRGRTLTFTEEKAPRLGSGTRGARVTVTGSPATRVVAFAGRGWAGVVYAQGDVSRKKINAFASHAYATAHRTLG